MLKLDRSSEIMTLPLRDARELFERQYLEAQLLRFGGNISRTAGFVGMERSALHRKLKDVEGVRRILAALAGREHELGWAVLSRHGLDAGGMCEHVPGGDPRKASTTPWTSQT